MTLVPATAESNELAVCPVDWWPAPGAVGTVLSSLLPEAAPANASMNVPSLHSNPGAAAKLFLDFDGHDEAKWGGSKNVHTPPAYSEQAAIDEIWARVAEDYAPFNIDVTTVDPGSYAHGVVAVIAIGGDYSDWFGDPSGGVAYIGGFAAGSSAPNVGYVFSETLNHQPNWIADAVSHEAGHLFGLDHQSVWENGGVVEDYNPGNDQWGPLMGVSYDAIRSNWHNGTPESSANEYQDDMAMIASSENGFGFRPDDFGDTFRTASALPTNGTEVSFSGLISKSDDRDVWRFTTTDTQISFALKGVPIGSNLDCELELWSSDGTLLASDNPPYISNAKIYFHVDAGTYYLVARGAGDYGDAGQYTIEGSLAAPNLVVSVDGVPIPNFGIVPFGTLFFGESVTKTFVITNQGNSTRPLRPMELPPPLTAVTVLSNIDRLSLAPGESTSFTLQFKAVDDPFYEGIISFTSGDFAEDSISIILRGSITPPNPWGIEVSADGQRVPDTGLYGFFDFGVTPLGIPITKTFTITNRNAADLTLNPLYSVPDDFTLIPKFDSMVLSPGESFEFQVRMNAQRTSGLATIFFNGDRSGNQFQLNLRAGVSQTLNVWSDYRSIVQYGDLAPFDFGRSMSGSWRAKTFSIVNDGSTPLLLKPLTPEDLPRGFSLVANFGTTSLAPGQSTFFVIGLDTAILGTRSGTILLNNSNGQEIPIKLQLSGNVVPSSVPEIGISFGGQTIGDGGTLDVGSVVQAQPILLTMVVTNLGKTRLSLAPLNANNLPSGFSLASNIGKSSLGFNESTSFTIRLNAVTTGPFSGTFHLLNNDSDESSYDLTVTGTVAAAERQIVDDGDAGNVFAGNWKQPTGKGYGKDIHYAAKGKGYVYSIWAYNNLPPGQYRVYVTWPGGGKNASNAPFTMFDGQTLRNVVRTNQRVAPGPQTASGRWKTLATVYVTSGQLVVMLTNAANGIVVADAVYIEQVSGLTSSPRIINSEKPSGASRSLTDAVALERFAMNVEDTALPKESMLPAAAATGQLSVMAVMTTERSVASEGSESLGGDGSVGALTKREAKSLASVIDLFGDEQDSVRAVASDINLTIRDQALTALAASSLKSRVS